MVPGCRIPSVGSHVVGKHQRTIVDVAIAIRDSEKDLHEVEGTG